MLLCVPVVWYVVRVVRRLLQRVVARVNRVIDSLRAKSVVLPHLLFWGAAAAAAVYVPWLPSAVDDNVPRPALLLVLGVLPSFMSWRDMLRSSVRHQGKKKKKKKIKKK